MTVERLGPVPSGQRSCLSLARDRLQAGAERSARHAGRPATDAAAADANGGQSGGQSGGPSAWPSAGPSAAPRRRGRRFPLAVPPQHGAWAFLIVPVLVGFAVAGTSPAGWGFGVAWVLAYPAGYYGGRALTARLRRGSWTRLARRELGRALPWLVLTGLVGVPVAWARPWLWAAAGGLALLWGTALVVADRRGERSLANDLLLVAQAVVAVPLSVAVVAGPPALTGPLATSTATSTLMVAAYLFGSVLHVKSLLREAGRPGYRAASIAWHVAAVVVGALVGPWWILGLMPALLRSLVLRPGLRPGAIGGIEAIVSVLVVAAAHAGA